MCNTKQNGKYFEQGTCSFESSDSVWFSKDLCRRPLFLKLFGTPDLVLFFVFYSCVCYSKHTSTYIGFMELYNAH